MRNPFLLLLVVLSLLVGMGFPSEARAEKVCIKNKNGVIVTKKRCPKNKTTKFTTSSYSAKDDEITDQVDTNTAAISTLNTTVSSIQNSVNSHDTTLTQATTDIDSLETSVQTLENTVATLQPTRIYEVAQSGARFTSISTAIQTAVNDGVDDTDPGVVSIAAGTYELSATLTIPNGVTLVGASQDGTVLEDTGIGAGNIITMEGGSSIENLTVSRTPIGGSDTLIGLSSATTVNIRRIGLTAEGASTITLIDADDSSLLIDGVTGTLTADAASLVGVSATGTTSITVSRSTFKITGDSNCTGLSFNTSGSTEVRESYISATDTASGGGDAVNALYIDSTTKTQVINSEFVADSTGAGTVAAIYLGSNQTIELFNAKLVCSGDDTTLGCLYADAGGTVLVSSSKIKGEALRSCAYADNASIIRAVNSLYACADSGTANGGTVSCRSVYASDLTTLIGDACG